MIRVAAVSYLNTKPFLDGIEYFFSKDELSIFTEVPSTCATLFREEVVDIALVPVGSLCDFKNYEMLNQYCIGADGKVDSVFLFAQKPITEIDRVFLDWHSRTSSLLVQLLMHHHWKRKPIYSLLPNYYDLIKENAAGLVIGDKAIPLKDRFRYCYDLAHEWQQWSKLPFTFAVWVYRKSRVDSNLIEKFEQSLGWGVQQVEQSALRWSSHYNMCFEKAFYYLSHCISYNFDASKHQSLRLFLHSVQQLSSVY